MYTCLVWLFFFQAEDGIRDLVRSRGLGDVYKRQEEYKKEYIAEKEASKIIDTTQVDCVGPDGGHFTTCLLYTSDAADERSSVDLGGRRIIKKKKNEEIRMTDRAESQQ